MNELILTDRLRRLLRRAERRNPVEEVLKELKSISEALNDSSDSLNATLTEINNEIKKLNLGIEVWLERSPLVLVSGKALENPPMAYDNTVEEGTLILGYARTSEGWGLAVKEVKFQEGFYGRDSKFPLRETHEKKIVPLLKTPRPVRAAAIRLIPFLLKALKKEGYHLLKDVQKAQKIRWKIAKKLAKNNKGL
jgi:hypothetical protein